MSTPLCATDYAARYGYEAHMGDDLATFAPGECSERGRAGICFTARPDWRNMPRDSFDTRAETVQTALLPAPDPFGTLDLFGMGEE